MPKKQSLEKSLILTALQLGLGLALLALSTHLALESNAYLEVLNQGGLNQYHAFALLVCLSFFSGIFLIAQYVLTHESHGFDELSPY
jgi:multisubunit Na+/H+ antiporter MnhC subunit